MSKLGKILFGILFLVSFLTVKAPATAVMDINLYLPTIYSPSAPIYSSTNLSGHEIFGECNPGGGTSCPCSSTQDAGLASFADFGQVTSNPRGLPTYVNAIGYKKFTETFPDGTPIHLGKYQYSGSFRITTLPKADNSQIENGQAIHLMIQLWDGRDALYQAERQTLEGVIYWQLNRWQADYGNIKIYVYPATLIDTGYRLEPDLLWHSFLLAVDLDRQEYLSITIGGPNGSKQIDLTGRKLAKVYHSDWGRDVALSITTESMATWPQSSCQHVFTWTTQFKNLWFYAIR